MRLLKIRLAKFAAHLSWQLSGKRRLVGVAVPVLCYHRVLPELIEGEDPVYSVTPQQFDAQLGLLARHKFQSLSLNDYFEMAQGRRSIPSRSVLITFDDGFADIHSQAWPIARRHGFTFNVFVCTGLICHQVPSVYRRLSAEAQQHQRTWPNLWRPLTWEEIGQMSAGGVGIGFHSHRHRLLSGLSEEALRRDLATGLHLCENHLGYRPRFFALPHGTCASYNQRALSVLRESGSQMVFTTRLGRTRLGDRGFLTSRIVVHQEDDLATFERKLYGAYDWLGGLLDLSHLLPAFRQTRRSPAPVDRA